MDVFAQRLKKCREDKKKSNPDYTQAFVAKKIGVARTTYTAYENGTKMPPLDTVNIIADFYDVSSDYLLGRDNKQINKASKDERDIAKKLESILGELDADNALAFDGEPMDETTRDLVRAQIESNLRVAKQMARKKFTPKKHINDESE